MSIVRSLRCSRLLSRSCVLIERTLQRRNFCDYVTKGEFTTAMESLGGELKRIREDLDKQVARARADVEVWGTPLIHIAAWEIVLFLMGHSERRDESVTLEGSSPFRYPGIVMAATRCDIKFDQFRRACDRSRVDRNRAAHAFDIEDLTLKVGHAQDIFEWYPYMAKKTPHQHLLISNFNTIKVVLEELHADGDLPYGA